MAVEFKFTLSDLDATNLIGVINDAKFMAMERAQEHMVGKTNVDQINADWYHRHAKYIEELKQKVLSGVVQTED